MNIAEILQGGTSPAAESFQDGLTALLALSLREAERSMIQEWQQRGSVPAHQKSVLDYLLSKYGPELNAAKTLRQLSNLPAPDFDGLDDGVIEMYWSIAGHSGQAAAERYLLVVRSPAPLAGHSQRRASARGRGLAG